MDFSFPKAQRLRTRADYKRMGKQSIKHVGQKISIDVRKSRLPNTRLGITVTKKFGDSHHRNRFKRIVREAFRLSYALLRRGVDVNVRPLHNDKTASMQEIQQELLHFLSDHTPLQ